MKPPASDPAAPPPTRRRVLLVDDHPFMRAGLALLIDKQPDMVVAGEAGNPADAMRAIAKGDIELILSDITMPGPADSRRVDA